MRIERKKLSEIKPADYNPRKISGSDYEKLKKNIEEFGYIDPIIFNEPSGNIVGGHQRYKVLTELGYEEIDVVVVEMDDLQEKALNIALNKISGEWDVERLKDVLLEIDVGGVDVELSGFDLSEIENMMTATHQDFNGNAELEMDDFDDDDFNCRCPECDFHFNVK